MLKKNYVISNLQQAINTENLFIIEFLLFKISCTLFFIDDFHLPFVASPPSCVLLSSFAVFSFDDFDGNKFELN